MQSNLSAVTDVTRTAHGYRARLRTASPTGSGERVLENARCEVLADSVAVVIALAVTTPQDEPHNDEAARWSVAVSAHMSALFGALPKPALGVGGAIAFEAPSLRFELRSTYHLPQSTTFAASELGARFSAVSFAARACWLPSVGAFDFGPCIGADVQHVSATGFGGDVMLSGQANSWGPALGALGRIRLAKTFGILAVAEGIMPITRQRFVYRDVGPLHRASVIAAQLLMAAEVHF
jgi:hypothetical protein